MKIIDCESISELRNAVEELGPNCLFRGQTKEYLNSEGKDDLRTSFARKGCVPSRMLKWYYYSKSILSAFVRGYDQSDDTATDQAILQHYGWISFYIDATSSAHVAAWFASHTYHQNRQIELIEDCWEDPLFAIKDHAHYEPSSARGCVYAISRKALRAAGIEAVDLVEITTSAGRPRFVAQHAFMVGPLTEALPEGCVAAKIRAPSTVLAEFASSAGMLSTDTLFPSRREDPVLAMLLQLPWVKRDAGEETASMDFFERGLPLPEYDPVYRKISSPDEAFYRRVWISQHIHSENGESWASILCGESIFHGGSHGVRSFPKISQIVQKFGSVLIEIDGLISHPPSTAEGELEPRRYGKGVAILRHDGLIAVGEMIVTHQGLRPFPGDVARGRFYSIDDNGMWNRVEHPDECDCEAVHIHDHHLTVIEHCEDGLSSGRFRHTAERVYVECDVIPSPDNAVLKMLARAD